MAEIISAAKTQKKCAGNISETYEHSREFLEYATNFLELSFIGLSLSEEVTNFLELSFIGLSLSEEVTNFSESYLYTN